MKKPSKLKIFSLISSFLRYFSSSSCVLHISVMSFVIYPSFKAGPWSEPASYEEERNECHLNAYSPGFPSNCLLLVGILLDQTSQPFMTTLSTEPFLHPDPIKYLLPSHIRYNAGYPSLANPQTLQHALVILYTTQIL